MGVLSLSVENVEIPIPLRVQESQGSRGRIRLLVGTPEADLEVARETVVSLSPTAVGGRDADLFYGEHLIMSVPTPRRGAESWAVPFSGGDLDPARFRLVARDGAAPIRGRVWIEQAPSSPLEHDVDELARRYDEDERLGPRADARAVVLVAAAVVFTLVIAAFLLNKAAKAINNLRGGPTTPVPTQPPPPPPDEDESDDSEDAGNHWRPGLRAVTDSLDDSMSVGELVSVRRALLRDSLIR